MEYWEGFFLGKYWTDSDYHDRRHHFLFITISLIVFLFTLSNAFFPDKFAFLIRFSLPVNLMVGLLLLIALPFAAAQYYRINIGLRLLILLGYILQYLFLFAAFIQFFVPYLSLDISNYSDAFLIIFDKIMVFSGDVFNFLGSLGSTIASVASGIIIGGLVVLFVILVSIFFPLLYLILFRALQRLIDQLIARNRAKLKI